MLATAGLLFAGTAAGAAEVRSPAPGANRTFMPVTIEVAFAASADSGTLAVQLNGSDITSSFTLEPPAGGEVVATAVDVWGGLVLMGANQIDVSVEIGGSPVVFGSNFDTIGDPFADEVVAYNQGVNGGFNADQLPTVALGAPIGGGLFVGALDVVSLGRTGSIELRFSDNVIVDGPGVDFTVFENAFLEIGAGSITQPPFAEPGGVSVSQDGVVWYAFPCPLTSGAGPYWPGCAGIYPVLSDGTLAAPHPSIPTTEPIESLVGLHILAIQVPTGSGGDSFDLADLGLAWVRFVRIDAADFDPVVVGTGTAGFDLDAVAAVHSAPSIPVAVPATSRGARWALAFAVLFAAFALLRVPRSS